MKNQCFSTKDQDHRSRFLKLQSLPYTNLLSNSSSIVTFKFTRSVTQRQDVVIVVKFANPIHVPPPSLVKDNPVLVASPPDHTQQDFVPPRFGQ